MRYWIAAIFLGLMQVTLAQDTLSVDNVSNNNALPENESAFAKANSLYTAENYQEAASSYESILLSGQHSAELYFNLGNAYYKMNQVGPAIYNFEKALQLKPTDSEIKNNLKFAEQLRIDTVEPSQRNPVQDFLNTTFLSLSVDTWAYISIMLALVAILCFILYHYATTTGKKRLFFVLSTVFLLGMIFSIVAASYSRKLNENNQQAIVYSRETVTRTEPKNSAESSFLIHEGMKVTIIEEYQDWVKIEVPNGSQSWMPSADLKKL